LWEKILGVISILLIIIVLVVLGIIKQSNTVSKNPNTIDLTEEQSTEMFKYMYGMSNLNHQNIYLLRNELYIEFYFDKTATESEIDSARSFALVTFALGKSSPYGEFPYMSLVDKAHKQISWDKTICTIYKNNKKIWYEKYNGVKLECSEKF